MGLLRVRYLKHSGPSVTEDDKSGSDPAYAADSGTNYQSVSAPSGRTVTIISRHDRGLVVGL